MPTDPAWRGARADRPTGFAVPPERMPLLRRGRPRKQWRYAGVYAADVMLCVGEARIGPSRQVWWAVWDRETRRLTERTRQLIGRGRVTIGADRVHVVDDDVTIDLALVESPAVETLTPDPGGWAWTSKNVARAHGSVRVAGRELAIDGPAVIDASAGYHPRHTSWRWSAGVGTTLDGRAVAWNLVDGVHDTPGASERSVWVDGRPAEVGTVDFEADLSGVSFAEGGALAFAEESTRAREDNLILFRSSYEQPFGTFSGTLPHAGELAEGFGVMERHDVVW
jgi:hypothetical protein